MGLSKFLSSLSQLLCYYLLFLAHLLDLTFKYYIFGLKCLYLLPEFEQFRCRLLRPGPSLLILELLLLLADALPEGLHHPLLHLNQLLGFNQLSLEGCDLRFEILLLFLAFEIRADKGALSDFLTDLAIYEVLFVVSIGGGGFTAIIGKEALKLQIMEIIEDEFVWGAEFLGSAAARALHSLKLTNTVLAIEHGAFSVVALHRV